MSDVQLQAHGYAPGFMPVGDTPAGKADVSVAGVLLLSALAVVMAIVSVVMLGLVVMGAWWLVSHIPVPDAVRHLVALL
jgi:hypothetical protein